MLRTANTVNRSKLWGFFTFAILVHALLLWRFFQLQILNHESYNLKAESNYIRAISVPAPRGLILDRFGEIIVDNYPTYIISGIDAEIKNKKKNYQVISSATGIDTSILIKNYKNYFRSRFLPSRIVKDLTISQLGMLEEAKNNLTGIVYEKFPERIYNSKARASHVLGYLKEVDQNKIQSTNKTENYRFGDLIGSSGIEKQYESILRGVKGVSYYQVDAFGREVGNINFEKKILPKPGINLNTTLDLSLQSTVEKIFLNKNGVAIVSLPKTGEILAYVSAPDYKPDLFTGMVTNEKWKSIISDTSKPLLNRGVNGLYPPGSIFKMVVAFELLEKNIVDEEWSVTCTGEYEFYDRVHRCWDENGHGKINLEQAIVQSCDVYFYEAIQKIKLKDLSIRAKQFLHYTPTGVDLPSEMKGRFPDRKYMNKLYGKWGWSKGALLNIAIGQGEILVTPLQTMAYTNFLAMRGVYFPLHFVKKNNVSPSIIDKNIKNSNWNKVHKYLKNVVSSPKGTAKASNPKIPDLVVSGKTGTAENPHGETHAWFIGYAEKGERLVSVSILVENGGGGGSVAAPMARKIFKYIFESPNYLKIADI